MATIRLLKQCRLKNFLYNKHRIKINHATQAKFHSNISLSTAEANVELSNGKNLKFSTGQYARFADGCTITTLGDTSVMVTTVSKTESSSSSSFLPLVVDYRQKAAAAGRIPTNFLRRELGPTEHEILTSRLIDRSLRPLFSKHYNNETQIICNTLAIDGVNDPEVLAINGASAALAVSNIPWNGPIGAVKVGLIDDEVYINPTRYEMKNSIINLVVSATQGKLVVMLEGTADNVTIDKFKKVLKVGVIECQNIIKAIKNLQETHGKPKRDVQSPATLPEEVIESMKSLYEPKLRNIFLDYKHDKISRDNAVYSLRNEVLTTMKTNYTDLNDTLISEALSEHTKQIFRSLIFENDHRCDGRKLDELRDISCQVDLFKPLHGSALFQRGQTQVLCTVTLDSPDSALKMDNITMLASGVKEKNFFLHYEFPPFATNEVGRTGHAKRRELGHGALAERGLRAALPKNYPFTIRLTSEVLESNGSSSMASICGGSLALMDAGVPISGPVAGVAIGLITKYGNDDPKNIEDYRILTDILGIEDYLGDMDFKIAGTKKGISAFQADVKIPGLPLKVIMESIEEANTAKAKIIGIMNQVISQPRSDKQNMPVQETIDIPSYLTGKLVGVGASNIKKIFLQTGVHINALEGSKFNLFAPNQEAMDEAKEIINQLVKVDQEPKLEFGGIYTAKIVEIRDTGVMITLYPSMTPTLLHYSQLDQRQVKHASALGFEVGHEIQVKYFGRDPASGAMRISRKVLQTTNLKMRNLTEG